MIVAEVIDRLKSAPGTPFRLIAGAAQLAALTDAPTALPAVFVFVKEEASGDNERLNDLAQRTEMDLGVVIVAGNVADALGAGAAADIEQLKAHVRSRLVGWQPASSDEAITHIGGQLVRSRAGAVWWEMTLGCAFYLFAEE